jgi:predicted outer membrane repeat protein
LNLTGTQFIRNTAQASGGGVAANGAAALQQAVFQGNLSSTAFGGGLYAFSTLNLTRSSFINNGALRGGGLYHAGGNADVINSLFARNSATISGAALYLGSTGSVNLEYLTVGNAALTFGAAIEVEQGHVNLYDSIVANQAIGLRNTGGTVFQDYNLFSGDTVDTVGSVLGGTHNATGDPKFVDAAHDNYHLGAGSAAINHAIDLGIPIDFDGDARPFGTGFDIGFDEYSMRFVYLPLIKK